MFSILGYDGTMFIWYLYVILPGIVGRISPKTWTAMELFLQSIATQEYESMASALIQMGATKQNVDTQAFARDLEKIFSAIQVCDATAHCIGL